jgi:peroxiredoxin
MKIEVGNPAPEFTLYNTEKQAVSLSHHRGKNVLLLFFPLAFTGTCTIELCSMRDHLHEYSDLNAEVFAISVDSLHVLRKWKELEGFNFEMLSDFNKEASNLYDTIYETFGQGMKGVSKRSAFVIDKDGIVRYAEVLDNAGDIPSFENIKDLLATLN